LAQQTGWPGPNPAAADGGFGCGGRGGFFFFGGGLRFFFFGWLGSRGWSSSWDSDRARSRTFLARST